MTGRYVTVSVVHLSNGGGKVFQYELVVYILCFINNNTYTCNTTTTTQGFL